MAFEFIKSQLLKIVEWKDDSKDTLVYRFPMNGRQLMTGSKLTVNEGQVAIFVHKGQIADVFTPGYYKLETKILPVLSQLMGIAYGFKNPFSCEVYFVNTKQFTNQKWGTTNPVTMKDKDFGAIRIKAHGTYAFKVNDATVLLKELFGTNSSFTTQDINQYLRSMLVSGFSDSVAESGVSALDLAANLVEFNGKVKEQIQESFATIGLLATNFVIESINFPEQVEKAIDTRSSLGVMGDKMGTYVQYEAAQAMRDAAKNENGSAAAFMGAGMGVGAGVGVGGMMGQALAEAKDAPTKTETEKAEAKKVCPECKAEVSAKAKFCKECGHKFVTEKVCANCGTKIKASSKFCPECGTKVETVKKCPNCGITVKGKFCPDCGTKIG